MPKRITIAGVPLSEFSIVHGKSDSAALILADYLERASGIRLPVIKDTEAAEHEIRVGRTSRICSRLRDDGIAHDGFMIKVAGGNLIIRGGSEKGDENGVWEFLERFIGWRFVHRDVDYLKPGDVELSEGIRYRFNPPYEYRQLDWVCARDNTWRRKNGINFQDFNWVGFVHTLSDLTEQNDPYNQPCLSDEAVLETVKKNVRRLLDKNPKCKIISVSQNDNQNYCKCPKCAAIDEEEGSHAGTLLRFVNAVADDIRDEYPDVSIETLAYQYTRRAPSITKPRDNVIIRLCSIECCFSHPLDAPDCEVNADFCRDIIEWGKIAKRLYIWDYVTDFSYYIPPFPNFRVLLPNMKFFADNHVVGMYPEGNYQAESGEFGELRAYLLGRAMWNPYMTAEAFEEYTDDFLTGYYGAAGAFIRKFLDFTRDATRDRHFNIWNPPLTIIPREVYEEHFDEISDWWNAACDAVRDDPVRLERVRKSMLQWTYVSLTLHPDAAAARQFFDDVNSRGIRWNEWFDFTSEPDFSLPPEKWTVR